MAIDQEQVGQFLAAHQAEIARLILQAYQEAGGHYAAMSATARMDQAQIDSHEFIASLLRGTPDRESITQTVQAGRNPTLGTDIVQMATAFEHLFTAWVKISVADRPLLAHELLRRSRQVFSQFRLNMSAAQISRMVQKFNSSDDPPSTS